MRPCTPAAWRFATLVAAAAALCIVTTAPPASAHAQLVSSTPGNGATLRQLPGAVSLTFSETVRTPAFVEVTAPDGSNVAVGATRVVDADVSRSLVSSGGGGPYALSYRITSADGHPVSGTVRFTLQGGSAGAAAPAPPAATDQTGGMGTGQLVLLLGALAVGLVALGAGTRRALTRSTAMVEEGKGGRSPRR